MNHSNKESIAARRFDVITKVTAVGFASLLIMLIIILTTHTGNAQNISDDDYDTATPMVLVDAAFSSIEYYTATPKQMLGKFLQAVKAKDIKNAKVSALYTYSSTNIIITYEDGRYHTIIEDVPSVYSTSSLTKTKEFIKAHLYLLHIATPLTRGF